MKFKNIHIVTLLGALVIGAARVIPNPTDLHAWADAIGGVATAAGLTIGIAKNAATSAAPGAAALEILTNGPTIPPAIAADAPELRPSQLAALPKPRRQRAGCPIPASCTACGSRRKPLAGAGGCASPTKSTRSTGSKGARMRAAA
jgi:hypothetical protein